MLHMIGFASKSWKLGTVRRTERKGVYAFGPFRYAWHAID